MKIINSIYLMGLVFLFSIMQTNILDASSHREAPLIASDPLADNVDLYAFRSPDDPNMITIIATYVPMQLPQGGPNYYTFGENIRYEIHIDNDASTPGDEIIYRFTFNIENEDPTTFFNIRLGKQNQKATYTLERSMDGGQSFSTIVSDGYVAPNNIGPRSINGPVGLNTPYADLFQQAITTSSSGEKVFAGPTDDPFFVDLGGIFDLGNSPRQIGEIVDGLACLNVSALAIQVPISTLLKDGAPATPENILDPNYVIGVWASASRPAIKTLSSDSDPAFSGDWVQVSRLGMPLTNEAVIPIGDKDMWNRLTPYDEITETTLDEYFYNPELALYMDDDQFGGAVPALSALRIQTNSLGAFDFSNGADGLYGLKGAAALEGTALDDDVFGTLLLPAPGKPRSVDLWPAFHTGVPNVIPYQLATGKEGNPLAEGKPFVNNFLPNGGDMLRLNMAVPATPRDDANFSSLGLIQAAAIGLTVAPFNTTKDLEFLPNMDGFPNGRRLEDDVTRIELQAVSGIVLAAVGLWYDDYDPETSPSPVTQDLLDVLTFTTGVERNDRVFSKTFPYLAMPFSATGNCEESIGLDEDIEIIVEEKEVIANIFVSSNTSGKIGVFNLNDDDTYDTWHFNGDATDADGIAYDAENDVLYQLNRTENVINAYADALANLEEGIAPTVTMTSTSDFSNGREIALYQDKIVVAQDASDANGQQNKLVVYQITDSGINLFKSFTTSINLWGIQLDGNNLFAVIDNSNDLAEFSNFLNQEEGNVEPTKVIEIEGLVRTHGLSYIPAEDLMLLTDIGDAASPSDGAFLVVQNYTLASADDVLSTSEQIRVGGDQTELGNPVDIAYNEETSVIFIAERASDGGKFLAFEWPTANANVAPSYTSDFAGASAIFTVNTPGERRQTYIPFNPQFDGSLLFAARLSGSNEVPAVTTNATGVIGVLVDPSFTSATINLSVNGLSSEFTGAHLHEAPAGSNGGVIVNLTPAFENNRISKTIDLDPALLEKMMNGQIYINVHTKNNPGGEIRGQVLLEQDITFANWITGDQEVPAVTTDAKGLVSVNYTPNLHNLEVNAIFTDLSSDITGAHLHIAPAGSNGGVAINLGEYIQGNSIIAQVNGLAIAEDLLEGNVYINIHTVNNPGGEIRGQLNRWSGISFDGWMGGEQNVPAQPTQANGFFVINLNNDFSNLTTWALTDNLSGDATAAHLHLGAQGTNGGVWINLGPGMSGNQISLESNVVDDEGITELLQGNVYLNVHTAENPAGEVRGQVYGLHRDGYSFDICKNQVTRRTVLPYDATGGGIVSLDRKGTNLHLMVVASSLTDYRTTVGIYNAAIGERGPLQLRLSTNYPSGGIFTYYTAEDFNERLGEPIRSGNAYVLHRTFQNPQGEIRGQIVKDLICDDFNYWLPIDQSSINISTFPNPSQDLLKIQNKDSESNITGLEIIDNSGRLIKGFDEAVNSEINISDLITGTYHLRIYTDNGNYTTSFVKK